ncbi:MAG: hypothetical protein HKN73_12940, partial [Gemmatimonadetes bacterium]|nr:hypothetical protein [Gemmatimonadota bacterium]
DVLARVETGSLDWSGLREEADHLGSADVFIERVLAAAAARGIVAITENE